MAVAYPTRASTRPAEGVSGSHSALQYGLGCSLVKSITGPLHCVTSLLTNPSGTTWPGPTISSGTTTGAYDYCPGSTICVTGAATYLGTQLCTYSHADCHGSVRTVGLGGISLRPQPLSCGCTSTLVPELALTVTALLGWRIREAASETFQAP